MQLTRMIDRIRQIVAAHTRQRIPTGDLIPAAVLIPLIERDGRVHLLMEKRPENLTTHKGQVSFPGGAREPGDEDAVATALREAHEEVGLDPADVEVFGTIDDFVTVTRFRVTPVVGRIPNGYPYRPQPAEVEALLEPPWELFEAEPPGRSLMEHDGQAFEVVTYPFADYQIWGATARMTRSLVELVQAAGDPASREEETA